MGLFPLNFKTVNFELNGEESCISDYENCDFFFDPLSVISSASLPSAEPSLYI
jgi:hypothetical protein